MRPCSVSVLIALILAAYNEPAEASKRRLILPRASSQAATHLSSIAQSGSLTTKTPQPDPSSPSSNAAKSAFTSASPLPSGGKTPISSSHPSSVQGSSDKPHSPSPSSALSSSGPSSVTAKAIASPTSGPTSNGTMSVNPNELPMKPTITPALSVAGVLLMLTGVFYTLIGIRTKRIHIFLSSAYLVSLAVTVLIIYVMHPPISNAIQGAYFVAAFFTGVIFGGGSVVFADVTEGMGCLLGGFCLSMWFLELRPGGLIQSTIGKAIFIACLTLGAYSVYISHFTRPYGLIGSTSFAGATIIVLGIDCFSRAGLKEFWVYIWDLNDALLPSHYSGTYPITRGIRVEIAATVLLFVLGVMSQMKVWKIVKKHRDQKAAERLEEEQQQDQAELALGGKIEERNERDKVMWEAVYGDQAYRKAPAEDSELGAGTTANSKTESTSAIAAHSFETISVKSAGNSERKVLQPSSVTIRVASEDSGYATPSATAESLLPAELETHEQSKPESLREPPTDAPRDAASMLSIVETANSRHSPEGSVRSDPQVIPLPFNVSRHDFKDDDERSSIATFAASDRPMTQMSKRLSGSSLLRSLSKPSKRRRGDNTPTEEASAISLEDDRASSVAATFDGVEDDLSSDEEGRHDSPQETRSLEKAEAETVAEPLLCESSTPLSPESLDGGRSDMKRPSIEGAANDGTLEPKSIDDYESVTTEIFMPARSTCGSYASRMQHAAATEIQRARSTKSATASELSPGEIHLTSFRDQLPEGASKVEMAYRTNEWAKHLDRAETPSVEDLKETSSTLDAQPVMEENSAPVNVRQLEQTALTAEPQPIKVVTNPETESSQQPYLKRSASWSRDSLPSQRNRQQRESSLRRASYGGLTNRTGSYNALQNPRGFRTSSTALHNSPLVESPIEEGVESFFPPRGDATATSAIPLNTLMAKRSSKLQNRYSTTPLVHSKSFAFPDRVSPLDSPDAEDLPLAQRKSLLKLQSRRSSNPTSPRTSPRTSAAYIKRNPSSDSIHREENRENMVTAWHTSLRNDSKANILSQRGLERKRSEMLGEKRRVSADLQAAGAEKARRESQRDENMRRGDMLERHREAMRKLQASVNV